MSSRWTGFFVWALVMACAALWGFRIFAATRPVPATATTPTVTVAQGPMVRLFGAVEEPKADDDTPAPESDRFQLVGVIAPAHGSANAYALVAIDGQPPKPFKVGVALEGNTTLLSVARRTAEFGPSGGPAAFTLELPEPAAPETGTLPPAVSQPNGPAPTPRPVAQMPGNPIPGAIRGASPVGFPGRPGVPVRPGMIPPNAVPPGRTAPMAGAQQIQPAAQDGDNKDDE